MCACVHGLAAPQSLHELPHGVVESGRAEMWDLETQTDKQVKIYQAGTVVIDTQDKKAVVLNVAISSVCNIREEHMKSEK